MRRQKSIWQNRPKPCFLDTEMEQIASLSAKMCADFAELDVLRDRHLLRGPQPHWTGLSAEDSEKAMAVWKRFSERSSFWRA